MKERGDPRVAVFERAADRLELTGARREIAKHYFLGKSGKEVRRLAGVSEGVRRRALSFLHGRLNTSDTAGFIHGIYEHGNGGK